jgi:hypothetical protein
MLELKREKYPELELGSYYHTAGSLHLYEQHFEMAKQISIEDPTAHVQQMSPLIEQEVNDLIFEEESLRKGKLKYIPVEQFSSGSVKFMAARLNDRRFKRNAEDVK